MIIRWFSLITLWLILLSASTLLAVKLEGNILFDEANPAANIAIQINSTQLNK